MSFEEPSKSGFTVYSKSGCPNCRIVKNLLKKENLEYNVIDCDDYLLFEHEDFLSFIKQKIGKEIKSFPIIFYTDEFVGGLIDTENYIHILKTLQ